MTEVAHAPAGRSRGAGLPSATRPATLSVVLLALLARREQGFRRADLEALGVPDRAYARGVLAFLDLLERSRPHRLKKGFLEARQQAATRRDPELIRSFLRHQLSEGLRRALGPALEPEALADLGRRDLHSGDLAEAVDRLLAPPADADARRSTPEKRDKTATCLKALHDAILHCDDLDWLAHEAGISLDWLSGELGIAPHDAAPWATATDTLSSHAARGATGRDPAASASPGPRSAPPESAPIGLSDAANPTVHAAGTFRIARQEDDRPVLAHVYFERPADPGSLDPLGPEQAPWFEQLALRLLDVADSLRRGSAE
jgi:hypothetical protein